MSFVVSNTKVAPYVHKLVIRSKEIAQKAQPGQFVIIIHDEHGERIPISIADWDREAGTIDIYVIEAGYSTQQICQLEPGSRVYSIAGPFGKPATIDKYGTVLVGGGCHGIAAVYPVARALKEAGNNVIVAIEGREDRLLYMADEFRAVADGFFACTSDGTSGVKGKVNDFFDAKFNEGMIFDHCYFVGCTFMMMVCTYAAMRKNVPADVELNALMLDGIGMCGCCRVTVDGKTKFACVDGPEFDGHKVDWLELLRRNAVYHDQELEANKKHGCKLEAQRQAMLKEVGQ